MKTHFLIAASEFEWAKFRFSLGWFSSHDIFCRGCKEVFHPELCNCGVHAWEQRRYLLAIFQSLALPISRSGERVQSALARRYQRCRLIWFRGIFLASYRALFGCKRTRKFLRTAVLWRGVERLMSLRSV